MRNHHCKDHHCHRAHFLHPLLALGAAALLTLVVWQLWNGALVAAVGVKAIGYWQALGILVLTRILFGRMPGHETFGEPWNRRRMMRHWESLTPEQRDAMREKMRERFGEWPIPSWCHCESGDSGESAKTGSPTNPPSAGPEKGKQA